MRVILWVDDDIDDFPGVRRAIRQKGCLPQEAYTVSEAIEWLENNGNLPFAVILDAIVPLGSLDLEAGLYPGLLVLQRFPALATKTVLLTVVPEKSLREAGVPAEAHVLSKLDLRPKDLREWMEKIAE